MHCSRSPYNVCRKTEKIRSWHKYQGLLSACARFIVLKHSMFKHFCGWRSSHTSDEYCTCWHVTVKYYQNRQIKARKLSCGLNSHRVLHPESNWKSFMTNLSGRIHLSCYQTLHRDSRTIFPIYVGWTCMSQPQAARVSQGIDTHATGAYRIFGNPSGRLENVYACYSRYIFGPQIHLNRSLWFHRAETRRSQI